MELTKVKLSDVARVEISGVDKKSKPGQKSVRLCNFVDVYHNWAITQDMRDSFMEATASDKEIEALSIKKGQVAFTKDSETRDDIGIPTYIADDFDDVVLGYHNALITPDERKLNGKYLNAFMHSSYIQKYFENNASGSGQRYTLSNDSVNSIPILLPTIKEQEKIGNLFSFIDRKIALNKKMNQKLEAMAKRLYDYWFVQYDFPDKNGHPYKTTGGPMTYNEVLKREIPAGWEVLPIGEILDKYKTTKKFNTSDYKTNGKYPIVDQDTSTFIAGYTDDEDVLKRFPAVLFGDHSTCVKFLNFEFGRGADGTQILYSKNERIHQFYLYMAIKSMSIPNPGYARHFKFLKEMPIILPCQELADEYQKRMEPIYMAITKADLESRAIIRLRDKLLPLLMNGQVEVK